MSALIIVSDAVEDYAAAHTSPAAAHLQALAAETRATLDSPRMLTGEVEGRLLEFLVFLARPRLVLEIGTYSGYSALSMEQALPDGGRIVTCELDPDRVRFAERHIAAAGLAGRIEVRQGPAIDTIDALDGPFDLVFVDADKRSIPEYFEWALRLTGPGSLIVVDNVVRDGRVLDAGSDDPSILGVRRFFEGLSGDERVSATVLQTVGSKGWDGLAIALVN